MSILIRSLFVSIGILGLIWFCLSAPGGEAGASAKFIAGRILAGDRFKPGALADVLASLHASDVSVVLRSNFVRADALIQLSVAEGARLNSLEHADRMTASADQRIKSSLALSPIDSFLWLSLYSTAIARDGFAPAVLGFLDQSYTTGPLEGWIALRRNPIALAAFSALSEGAQAKVVTEFAKMVDHDFTNAAAHNLTGAGWTHRDRLLDGLTNVDPVAREAFAKFLASEGVKIDIPGVKADERWWR